MRRWFIAFALIWPTHGVMANDDAMTLAKAPCPFEDETPIEDYAAQCFAAAWSDGGVEYQSIAAVFEPDDPVEDADPVIYIPGGPGDAPVTPLGDVSSIAALFPGRSLITMNPRGVEGTEPRPACTFESDFWAEELSDARETEITVTCRDAVREQKIALDQLDAPYLSQDIRRLASALELTDAGIFSVSYGTESALHLLADRPDWLRFAVLDSVSLPGVLGIASRLRARDRFLGVIDRLCFKDRECPRSLTRRHDDLMSWTAQFDDDPLKMEIGESGEPWSLDGNDVLDFIASMASYPDGAGYGPVFIEAMEDDREGTADWVASELTRTFDYASENFALLYGAYSDSGERHEAMPEAGDTIYPFSDDEFRDYARLFRVWNDADRTEPLFVTAASSPKPVDIPVLILSGGVDSLTPLVWAEALHRRFAGFKHFVFPDLGHAVAFGTDEDVNNSSVASQLRCGPRVIAMFMDGEKYADCARYERKTDD